MSKDKLEIFIQEHRTEIDDKTPPDNIWNGIERRLSNTKWYNNIGYWKAAAMLFFVLSAALLINNFNRSTGTSESLLATEFENTESYYFNLIEDKESLLTSYLQDYPALANDFKEDLEDLSENYKTLKKDYDATGNIEVLSALIKNLQLQQELLNNQLQIIELIQKENEDVSI